MYTYSWLLTLLLQNDRYITSSWNATIPSVTIEPHPVGSPWLSLGTRHHPGPAALHYLRGQELDLAYTGRRCHPRLQTHHAGRYSIRSFVSSDTPSRTIPMLRTHPNYINVSFQALSIVFGYNAHRLKCHPDTANQTPSEFLRSLFFAVSTITPPADNNNLSGSSHKHRHRRVSNSRNSAGKSPIAPSVSISTARSRRTSISRSVSHLVELKPSITTLGRPQLDSEDADPKASINPEVYSQRPSFHPAGAQTDASVLALASSIKTHLRNLSRRSTEALTLPSAVVVSGLELASLPSQKAVLRTLAERKIVVSDGGIFGHDQDGLTLELPDGFFMVYVCRSDPRERPPIYKSLVRIAFA